MVDLDKELKKVHIQSELLLLEMEKELDKMTHATKLLSLPVFIFEIFIMFGAIGGWLGMTFPKQFLNGFTDFVGRTVLAWTFFTALFQILNTWKFNRQSDREMQERILKRENESREVLKERLLTEKAKLDEKDFTN